MSELQQTSYDGLSDISSGLESFVLQLCDLEKRRIGQDLHDSAGQQLTGISLMCKALEHRLRNTDPSAAERVRSIAELIDDTIEQIRHVISDMAPPEIQDQDAAGALEVLCGRIEDIHHIACEFQSDFKGIITIPDVIKNLYFITQESVHNAIRHGKATRIQVKLTGTPDDGRLTIINNGTCDQERFNNQTGIGLCTMRFRARALNGTLSAGCTSPSTAAVTCCFKLDDPDNPGEPE
jgi:signal transduction histidine kinase